MFTAGKTAESCWLWASEFVIKVYAVCNLALSFLVCLSSCCTLVYYATLGRFRSDTQTILEHLDASSVELNVVIHCAFLRLIMICSFISGAFGVLLLCRAFRINPFRMTATSILLFAILGIVVMIFFCTYALCFDDTEMPRTYMICVFNWMILYITCSTFFKDQNITNQERTIIQREPNNREESINEQPQVEEPTDHIRVEYIPDECCSCPYCCYAFPLKRHG